MLKYDQPHSSQICIKTQYMLSMSSLAAADQPEVENDHFDLGH